MGNPLTYGILFLNCFFFMFSWYKFWRVLNFDLDDDPISIFMFALVIFILAVGYPVVWLLYGVGRLFLLIRRWVND